jgi:hypothetical protein
MKKIGFALRAIFVWSSAATAGMITDDVPEPGTLALPGLGLIGLGAARRLQNA